ncbi:hypothetical protein CPB84DRAFT_1688186 [Gymnopilus junonius]|uniref:Uncharacterized protein n=1 Tax=Gymnopilus junonius TaxID=109634 RepID=A0A9P5NC61_GYMJU|nr:hypothetical protein CPB84DRAFT_1688186 [Gymnopilus junonius]
MFGLIRRISYGVIPRADRPWEEDPTSNAPQRRKKRRLSSTERPDIDADEEAANKKARAESGTPDADRDATFLMPPPATSVGASADTQEVKEVTQGVKEVDLDGRDATPAPAEEEDHFVPAPESIPLPDEKSGELDELNSDASTPPPTQAMDGDDVSSSSSEVTSQDKQGEEDEGTAPPSDLEIATAEKGLKDVPAETIAKSVEISVSPAGITQN